MNSTIVEQGSQMARDGLGRGPPPSWTDPLFGIIPMPLVLNFATVALVALIFLWLLRGSNKSNEMPLTLLKRRYAAGEIDRKAYLQMKEDIAD